MKTRVIMTGSSGRVDSAVQVLTQGGLVAFPTDTVYGLGALVSNPLAIGKLYEVKGRDQTKAIPVLIGDLEDLDEVALELTGYALELTRRFWPGPLTLVVAKRPDLPDILSTTPTIGVRMPDHPDALDLLKATGPLAVTSANRSGGSNPLTAEEVFDQLSGSIPLVLDSGKCSGGNPSTVIDCTVSEPVILRAGPITMDQIRAVTS